MEINTVYGHATDTSSIEAVERYDGGADIIMTCGIGTTHESMMRYALPINECDKFGAALCKDIINNYREHNDHLKQRDEDSQSAIRDCIVEHNQHTHQLYARIEYLEAINRGLEQDIENLRIANALYRKRWSESELVHDMSGFHGMRSQNFERLVKGYHGMLKRIGKTIIITLPFEQESVARNAEKYIVGLED